MESTKCGACGADLAEGSRFCSACGAARQDDPPAAAESSGSSVPATTNETRGIGRKATLIVVVVLVLALGSALGVTAKIRADREKAAAARAAVERAAELKRARGEALEVLAAVEKCESAVEVGVTLDDLSEMSTDAKQAVQAFKRSEASVLLPRFSKEVEKAADEYVESCRQWLSDNESAFDEYDEAVDRWADSGAGDSPDLDDFQDDSEYQQSWVNAGVALDMARASLEDESGQD